MDPCLVLHIVSICNNKPVLDHKSWNHKSHKGDVSEAGGGKFSLSEREIGQNKESKISCPDRGPV